MKKETNCNYCSTRILVCDIGKTPGWIRISKSKPNNVAITGCPVHRDIVFDLFQEWMKKAGENDEYEVEGLEIK